MASVSGGGTAISEVRFGALHADGAPMPPKVCWFWIRARHHLAVPDQIRVIRVIRGPQLLFPIRVIHQIRGPQLSGAVQHQLPPDYHVRIE